jgi:hypothetical protein
MARLGQLRQGLLELHKTLLNLERAEYEQTWGPVATPARFFELVTTHPAFKWLRSLSELIISLDELADKPDPTANLPDLLLYTKALLTPNESGNEFARKYQAALQKHPGVAVAHGHVMQALKD